MTRLKNAIKNRARTHGSSYKDSAIAGAVGVGGYYVSKYLAEKVDFVKDKWYGIPVIMALGGHFLKKKNAAAGFALLGAAGYSGALYYEIDKGAKAQQANNPNSTAKGYDNAGDLAEGVFDVIDSRGFDNAGALQDIMGLQEVSGLQEASGEGDIAGDEAADLYD